MVFSELGRKALTSKGTSILPRWLDPTHLLSPSRHSVGKTEQLRQTAIDRLLAGRGLEILSMRSESPGQSFGQLSRLSFSKQGIRSHATCDLPRGCCQYEALGPDVMVSRFHHLPSSYIGRGEPEKEEICKPMSPWPQGQYSLLGSYLCR